MLGDFLLKLRQLFCLHKYEFKGVMHIPLGLPNGDNAIERWECKKCGWSKVNIYLDSDYIRRNI